MYDSSWQQGENWSEITVHFTQWVASERSCCVWGVNTCSFSVLHYSAPPNEIFRKRQTARQWSSREVVDSGALWPTRSDHTRGLFLRVRSEMGGQNADSAHRAALSDHPTPAHSSDLRYERDAEVSEEKRLAQASQEGARLPKITGRRIWAK